MGAQGAPFRDATMSVAFTEGGCVQHAIRDGNYQPSDQPPRISAAEAQARAERSFWVQASAGEERGVRYRLVARKVNLEIIDVDVRGRELRLPVLHSVRPRRTRLVYAVKFAPIATTTGEVVRTEVMTFPDAFAYEVDVDAVTGKIVRIEPLDTLLAVLWSWLPFTGRNAPDNSPHI
jgi:hypothetical protein